MFVCVYVQSMFIMILETAEPSNIQFKKKSIPYTVMFYAMLGKKNKQTKYLQQEMVVDILAVAMYIPSL